jgi:hypothetical protein
VPDTQIHPTGTLAVPADYVIPASAELLLKNAYAHFDGSGAAGSYLPLLRIISDAGSTVVEAVADTTIAAGASADASWFPRVGAAAASTSFAAGWVTHFNNNITVPPGLSFTDYDFTAGTTYTNDATTFTIDATNGLKLNSLGWYQTVGSMLWEVDSPATGYAEMLWNIPNGNLRTVYAQFVDDAGVISFATTDYVFGFPMKTSTVGSHGKLRLRQFGSSDATCALSFSVVRTSSDKGNF